MDIRDTYTHLLESSLAVIEIQGSEDHLQAIRLRAFVPAAGNQIPFGLEFAAHQTAITSIHSGQNDGGIVISGLGGQFLV